MRTIALLLAVTLIATPAAAETITGLPYVIDGDSLRFPGVEVRLEALDAPEWDQLCRRADGTEYPCGTVAKDALRSLIAGRPVTCVGVPQPDGTERDRYNRLLGDCRVGETSINAWMVENGHALAFVRYTDRLKPQEDAARAGKRGMWQGEFVAPWEFRASKRVGR